MADIIGEKWDSRSQKNAWTGSTATYTLLAEGTEDDSVIAGLASANLPGTFNGLLFQDYELNHMGGGFWVIEGHYIQSNPTQYSFDTGGGSQKITQSLSTVNAYAAAGGTPPNHHGAIGVTKDGIDGCEVTVPVYNFTETHYLPIATVTSGYKAAVYALTGLVNNASWRGFNTGEVLFLGASGTERGFQDWEITFKFAASPTVTGLSIGPFSSIDKGGWEYLWFEYVDDVDTGATLPGMIKRPVNAYVEQVYNEGDFTTLGIGS